MSQSKFFLVWNPEGRNPVYRHSSEHLATAEARRLARENPCHVFFVLEAKSFTQKQDVVTTQLDDLGEDGIPF